MTAHKGSRRKKNGKVYVYGAYYCGFAVTKGETVCDHRVRYPQDELEQSLLARFAEATELEYLERLCRYVNEAIAHAYRAEHDTVVLRRDLASERGRLSRLIDLATDEELGEIDMLRTKLADTRGRIAKLEERLEAASAIEASRPPALLPSAVRSYLAQFMTLVAEDLPRAKAEMRLHIEGDLRVFPDVALEGQKACVVRGRVTTAGLLGSLSEPGGQLVARNVYCGGPI
jgi:hypothetical protein